MTDEEEIELTPCQDSPWYKFALESVDLDGEQYDRGYHWFWGINFLRTKIPEFPKFDIKTIQNKLPDGHWLKESNGQQPENVFNNLAERDAFSALIKHLREINEITKIDFSNLRFEKYLEGNLANFSKFIFPINVSFKNTVFDRLAIFSETCFFKQSRFKALDLEPSTFEYVKFNKSVFFIHTMFFSDISFNDATFKELTLFTKSTFSNHAFFRRTDLGTTSFNDAHFKTRVPHFYDAKIGADIAWDRNTKLWPQIEQYEDYEVYKGIMVDNQNAYENLASSMEKLDKYHDRHFFFRGEMRCQRWLASYPAKCFYWLYETFSDYGYGIENAILGWFLHIFIGAILIGSTTKSVYNKTCDLASDFYLDMIVSFSNAHGVLFFSNGLLKECYDTFKILPAFKFIWGIQTILGIIFLFLVLLTLRVRFRLK